MENEHVGLDPRIFAVHDEEWQKIADKEFKRVVEELVANEEIRGALKKLSEI
ncbi:hypothetical protein NFX39_02150 [Fructobacillus sp. W13]|uniref:Uncharacterized protein n=1 Tax=Fructobacillus apis TaxID=2935017 RepID=A0ABT0ZPH6_9LACO|nr:hypothetical protein [Fructobacillus apis]MCO0831897.1 hypothetical protein [Fructobacillus apis]